MALAKIRDRQHPMKHALLIIDVQQALCSGAEAAFDIDRVVDRINSVSTKARVAGGVSHPARGNRGIFIDGTEGWRLCERLAVQPRKFAFARPLPTRSTRQNSSRCCKPGNVEKLAVCGLQSDFCGDWTCTQSAGAGLPSRAHIGRTFDCGQRRSLRGGDLGAS